jgi:hypothetical protein
MLGGVRTVACAREGIEVGRGQRHSPESVLAFDRLVEERRLRVGTAAFRRRLGGRWLDRGIWHSIRGIWHSIRGIWYSIRGIWYSIRGI